MDFQRARDSVKVMNACCSDKVHICFVDIKKEKERETDKHRKRESEKWYTQFLCWTSRHQRNLNNICECMWCVRKCIFFRVTEIERKREREREKERERERGKVT
jgi:hypothetical protein